MVLAAKLYLVNGGGVDREVLRDGRKEIIAVDNVAFAHRLTHLRAARVEGLQLPRGRRRVVDAAGARDRDARRVAVGKCQRGAAQTVGRGRVAEPGLRAI